MPGVTRRLASPNSLTAPGALDPSTPLAAGKTSRKKGQVIFKGSRKKAREAGKRDRSFLRREHLKRYVPFHPA